MRSNLILDRKWGVPLPSLDRKKGMARRIFPATPDSLHVYFRFSIKAPLGEEKLPERKEAGGYRMKPVHRPPMPTLAPRPEQVCPTRRAPGPSVPPVTEPGHPETEQEKQRGPEHPGTKRKNWQKQSQAESGWRMQENRRLLSPDLQRRPPQSQSSARQQQGKPPFVSLLKP